MDLAPKDITQVARAHARGSKPPAGIPRTPSRHRMLWSGCALVVFAIALFQVYDVIRRHEIVVETAERHFSSLVRSLAEQSAAAARAADLLLRSVAYGAGKHRSLEVGVPRWLQIEAGGIPELEGLAVLNANAKLVSGLGRFSVAQAQTAEYFSVHRERKGDRLYVSKPLLGADGSRHTVALSRRVDGPGGSFAGVAVAFLDLEYFQRFYAALAAGPGTELKLLRSDGILLTNWPDNAAEIGMSLTDMPLYRQLLASSHGAPYVMQTVSDGKQSIHAAQMVSGFPLAVVVNVDKDKVLAAWYVSATHSAARTSLLCAAVILLMWLGLRQLRRRERAEDRLRVESAHLDELFESAPEAIVILDLDGRVTRLNREFTRVFGYTAAEACGHSMEQLIVPEDLKQDAELAAQAVALGRRTSRETERINKDGRRIQVSMLGAPIVTPTGQIASYSIYRDITERKLADAERAKLEFRVRQAEKLQAIGTMAGGIAHDFNNILAAMLGYLEMALAAPPELDTVRRHVGNVLKAAHRARALVDQILTYSRTTQGKSDVVNVAAVIEETCDLVRASVPDNIDMRVQTGLAKGIAVITDPTHVHQLVMNLCTNAVHAMPAGGTLTVALDLHEAQAERDVSHGTLSAGRYVKLSVEDSGSGMEPQTTQRIFEPFFTTNSSGTGTGLGLALVYGIVTEMGGAIDVRSRPLEGSRFDVYLPRSDTAVIETAAEAKSWTRGQGQRVLIVEDERFLMLLAEEMLAALCYEPAGFTGADEALQAYLADPHRFDAALLDHVMPSMTGIELAKRLREVRPDLPIVLVSGYMGPLLEQDATLAGIDSILTKPLDLLHLSETMAGLFAAASQTTKA